MKEEKDIVTMDFAEYLRRSGVSENSKVCFFLFCFFFFSIITLYTKNVKQIKNTINSAPITIYVVGGKLNVKK